MTYIRALDGLRAIAVLFVIASHWLSDYTFFQKFPFGEIGVDIFFVLSGFLITTILIKNRSEFGNTGSRLLLVRQFVIRRTLRIFPIYYLTIFILFILGSRTGTNIREDFVYYITYTSNILRFVQSSWDGMISHLWTLAVEEQFYLVWPWLMLFLRRKWLLPLIVLTIVCGVISGAAIPGFGWVLTNSCLDAFGIGAFLAYDEWDGKGIVKRHIAKFVILACLLLIATFFTYNERYIPLRTTVSLVVFCLIFFIKKPHTIGNIFFSAEPLVFLGKVSYGIYLYHNIVPWLWQNFLIKLTAWDILKVSFSKYTILLQEFVALIILSWLSWIIVEKRINALKRYFPYK